MAPLAAADDAVGADGAEWPPGGELDPEDDPEALDDRLLARFRNPPPMTPAAGMTAPEAAIRWAAAFLTIGLAPLDAGTGPDDTTEAPPIGGCFFFFRRPSAESESLPPLRGVTQSKSLRRWPRPHRHPHA